MGLWMGYIRHRETELLMKRTWCIERNSFFRDKIVYYEYQDISGSVQDRTGRRTLACFSMVLF
jgi:hypothetical protein